jgi:hypothetical protein
VLQQVEKSLNELWCVEIDGKLLWSMDDKLRSDRIS